MSAREASAGTSSASASLEDLECVRNEEYKIWKKQSPFLYDVCVSKAMQSPSSSVQWYPIQAPSKEAIFDTYSLLLTSSAIFGGSNAAYRAQCELPRRGASAPEIARRRDTGGELKVVEPTATMDFGPKHFSFSTRYSPKAPQLVASAGRQGSVKLFKDDQFLADLSFHTGDCYDLAWSPHSESLLATVSTDGSAALWDAATHQLSRSFVGPNNSGVAESASPALNAVQFAPKNSNELATVGDDRSVQFWDLRTALKSPVRIITDAHAMGITALDYSPFNEMLLATGSADGVVSVWDVRMSSASLMGLSVDAGQVNSLKFSPSEASVFATGGTDAQVKVWDLSQHGQPQTAQEEEEGPPELMFIHGGHMAAVLDIAWHPTLPWTLCSVSEDSLVGIWGISSAIVN